MDLDSDRGLPPATSAVPGRSSAGPLRRARRRVRRWYRSTPVRTMLAAVVVVTVALLVLAATVIFMIRSGRG